MIGMIHYAQLANSSRLQKVLQYLSDGRPHTTLEIIQATGLCAINSIISELRMNGIRIKCNAVKGFKGRYEYTLGRI
jgi:hypothetical protein